MDRFLEKLFLASEAVTTRDRHDDRDSVVHEPIGKKMTEFLSIFVSSDFLVPPLMIPEVWTRYVHGLVRGVRL